MISLPFEKDPDGEIPLDDAIEATGIFVSAMAVPTNRSWRPGILFRFLDAEGDHLKPPTLFIAEDFDMMRRVGQLLIDAADGAIDAVKELDQ